MLGDLLRVTVRVREPVLVLDLLRLLVRVAVGVLEVTTGGRDLDGEGVGGVRVWLAVAGRGVRDALTVALGDGVPEALAVALDEGVPVALAEALDDGVPDALATPPPPLGDGGAVPLGDGVPDALGVALGVPDGLRSDAMPRPRYVKLATAASASPASHSSADSRTPLTMALDGTRCVTAAYRKHGDGADRKRRAVSARANA